MKSKRSPLLEYREVDPKKNPFPTTSNYQEIPATEEDGKELFERLKLVYQFRERERNYCKDCSDKDKCMGCIWRQIHFHILAVEDIMEFFIKFTKVRGPQKPLWYVEQMEEFNEEIADYHDIINPAVKFNRSKKPYAINLRTGETIDLKDK